ncbi:MAG: hypothetical protein MMC23_003501 [Stictis urceolatum]|nr:hypothetical protein [Stictis urceolata]
MSSAEPSPSALAASNTTTLGASFPVITLPDGSQVPTGTVGALLVNIKAYDAAHVVGNTAEMARLEPLMRAAIPLLRKFGMFELFPPEEWAAEGREGVSQGRWWVGREAMA